MIRLNKMFRAAMLSLILFLVGIKGLYWVVMDTSRIIKSKTWEVYRAEVVSTELKRVRRRSFSPIITYVFDYKGDTYFGDKYTIPSKKVRPSQAEAISEYYFPGRNIDVYIDPLSPQESVIIRPEFSWWFTFGLGGFASSLLCFSLYYGVRKVKNFHG